MATYMADLPGRPSFPVYGLGEQFDGYRWLTMWNDHDHLYTVTLGHGQPEVGRWIAVATFAKTPQTEPSDAGSPLVAVGPTGFNDALFNALIDLGDRHETGRSDAQWVTDRVNEAQSDGHLRMDRPDDLGPLWHDIEITIDERAVAASAASHQGRSALLVDLPTVAIAVTGPEELADLFSPLTGVIDTLDRYI